MSGAHETQPAMSFSRVEGGRGLEGVFGEDHLDFRRLNTARDQHVEREVMRRRVLRQHQLLAPQVGRGLDVLADHDAVAAVGEIDLLVDARHDPAVAWGCPAESTKLSRNSGTISSVAQPMGTSPAA